MTDYRLELKFRINPNRYKIVAFYPIVNNCCCDKDFFILTANKVPVTEERPKGINYSCQCACGVWCTSGHQTEQEAVDEYRQMCELYRTPKEDTKND